MLFYICPSVAQSCDYGDAQALDFIFRLIDSRRRGLLLIHASEKTYRILVDALRKNGMGRMADIVSIIAKRRREKSQLIDALDRYVYVSMHARDALSLRFKKMFILSPKFINRTNLFYPPVLLAENLTDCSFYCAVIASNFNDDIPSALRRIRLFERFENGGGNNTHTVYEMHKQRMLDFCICIVDSDRKCPDESDGDTAAFVRKVDARHPSSLCEVRVIDMYSAENLIPLAEIKRQYVVGKNPSQVTEFSRTEQVRSSPSWQYLPLKKGIKGNDLKKQSAFGRYWRNELALRGINVDCCEQDPCNCIILPAVSDKTLANAVATAKNGWAMDLNRESHNEVRGLYAMISLVLRSWLCVGQEIRV